MPQDILSTLKIDPPEVTAAMDYLTRIAMDKLVSSTAKPLMLGFYYVEGKVAAIPLVGDTPQIAWETPVLQKRVYELAYHELIEESMRNLAVIFPTMRYGFNRKAQIPEKMKAAKGITLKDLAEWHRTNPEVVIEQPSLMYIIDIDGEYYQAYSDLRLGSPPSLAEYVLCSSPTNSVVPMLRHARDNAFK